MTSLLAFSARTLAAVVLLPQLALAADLPGRMPVKAPARQASAYDWSGAYLGGHFGYEWGRTRVEQDGIVSDPNAKTDGINGGALAGYNWQIGSAVVSLEGDFGWSNAHGVGAVVVVDPVTTRAPNTYDLNWTSHARGRLGYAFDGWLLFAAGGLAVADFDFHEGAIETTAGAKYYGWSAGGGVERALTGNLIARVEYLYDDYGHKDYAGIAGDQYRVSLTAQTLRGALTWKFAPLGIR
jgi:outer membrane immunogenic protein